MSGSVHPFRVLTRQQLETLLAAHRAEYLDSFFEFIKHDRALADEALADFERDALADDRS